MSNEKNTAPTQKSFIEYQNVLRKLISREIRLSSDPVLRKRLCTMLDMVNGADDHFEARESVSARRPTRADLYCVLMLRTIRLLRDSVEQNVLPAELKKSVQELDQFDEVYLTRGVTGDMAVGYRLATTSPAEDK